MLPCYSKQYLGIDCPGCGLQRSGKALMNGQLLESIALYPMLIPILLMLIFLLLHLKFKFENGAKILVYIFVGNTLGIMITYIFKIIST